MRSQSCSRTNTQDAMHPDVLHGIGTVDLTVTPEMTATLDGKEIHRVYSTFWLAYHAEVAARRAIEPYFEADDNAVGSGLEIKHLAMAAIGAHVRITATVCSVEGRAIRCAIDARVIPSGTVIATGTQDQIVLPSHVLSDKASKALTT